MQMNLFKMAENAFPQGENHTKAYHFLGTVIAVLALLLAAGILFPTAVSVIFHAIWVIFIALAIVFFTLGILVILGMKNEVSRILDVLLEGGLSLIDFVHFLREVWRRFLILLKEFVVWVAPILSYCVTLLLYVLIMLLYKNVGKTYDVTFMTIILTFVLVFVFGLIAKPRAVEPEIANWKQAFVQRFRTGIIDGLEIVLFIFFLTMDATNLFFLPAELNVPLTAEWGEYDLMVRSFMVNDHFQFTVNLIVASISIEIIRTVLKVVTNARGYYKNLLLTSYDTGRPSILFLIKEAVRQSFIAAKIDIMRFTAHTTVLFLVFLLFPKLKLLTLVVASVSNLLLDLIISERRKFRKGTDLISRTLGFVFRI